MIIKKMPPVLSEFLQRLFKRAMTETFDREMEALIDKQLFVKLDKDKKGRLTYNEFKELFEIRRDMISKELGHMVYDYSDEQIEFRYQFACSLAESDAGPTLRSFDKWMTMHRFFYDNKIQDEQDADEQLETAQDKTGDALATDAPSAPADKEAEKKNEKGGAKDAKADGKKAKGDDKKK